MIDGVEKFATYVWGRRRRMWSDQETKRKKNTIFDYIGMTNNRFVINLFAFFRSLCFDRRLLVDRAISFVQ